MKIAYVHYFPEDQTVYIGRGDPYGSNEAAMKKSQYKNVSRSSARRLVRAIDHYATNYLLAGLHLPWASDQSKSWSVWLR